MGSKLTIHTEHAGVTITGTVAGDNQFTHNGNAWITGGIEINSKGNILINYVTSEENTGDGAWLVNMQGKGTISVTNSSFNTNSSQRFDARIQKE